MHSRSRGDDVAIADCRECFYAEEERAQEFVFESHLRRTDKRLRPACHVGECEGEIADEVKERDKGQKFDHDIVSSR